MRRLTSLALAAVISMAACGGGTPNDGSSPTSTPTPTATGEGDAIELEAEDSKFETDTITVAAGSTVRIEFKNRGSLPHNFAVYESDAAQQEIFTGDIILEGETLYTFAAPAEAGDYFFRCDVHPATMTGAFIVT